MAFFKLKRFRFVYNRQISILIKKFDWYYISRFYLGDFDILEIHKIFKIKSIKLSQIFIDFYWDFDKRK